MNYFFWDSCLTCETTTKEPKELVVISDFHHRSSGWEWNSEPLILHDQRYEKDTYRSVIILYYYLLLFLFQWGDKIIIPLHSKIAMADNKRLCARKHRRKIGKYHYRLSNTTFIFQLNFFPRVYNILSF